MSELEQIFKLPEGVKFVGVSASPGHGYRFEGGEIYGSPTHPYGPGAVIIAPADGYEFKYDVLDDVTRAVKKKETAGALEP
jgi:hypothetical protein